MSHTFDSVKCRHSLSTHGEAKFGFAESYLGMQHRTKIFNALCARSNTSLANHNTFKTSTTFGSGSRSYAQRLGADPSAEFSRYLAALLTRKTYPLHKSELSPGIVVFRVAFLVICYVSQLPRLAIVLQKHCYYGNYFSPGMNRA
ncbi:hypothetical protein CC86DRAFT_366743, partial [Ophiobolus disseminans]